jgi:hypothetical protein
LLVHHLTDIIGLRMEQGYPYSTDPFHTTMQDLPFSTRNGLIGLFLLAANGILNAQIDFAPFTQLNTQYAAHLLALGDVNNDGFADVVVGTDDAEAGPDRLIRVYLGNGNGVGPTPTSYPFSASYPGVSSIDLGDVNNDALNDVIVSYDNKVGLFLQASDNTLLPVQEMVSSAFPMGVATGDLNNDGRMDIVAAYNDDQLRVHEQITGGFNTVAYSLGGDPMGELRTGDMNGDGLTDVVGLSGYPAPGVSVFLQNVNGALDPVQFWPLPESLWPYAGMDIGDLDSDGLADVAVSRYGNGSNAGLLLLYQDALTNALDSVVTLPTYDLASGLQLVDLDCDDDREVVVMHPGWMAFTVYTRGTDGTYGGYQSFPMPYVNAAASDALALGDVDGDQRPDLVYAEGLGVQIALNTSFPAVADSVHLTVTTDTLWTDTLTTPGYSSSSSIDTVDWAIIWTVTEYSLLHHVRRDQVRVDSLSVRFGPICGQYVVDTLLTSAEILLQDTVTTDTLNVWVFFSDTLNLGMATLPTPGVLGLHPNPAHGQVIITWPASGGHAPSRAEVVDATGAVVHAFTARGTPHVLDLSSFPPGVFVLRLRVAERTWHARLVVQ